MSQITIGALLTVLSFIITLAFFGFALNWAAIAPAFVVKFVSCCPALVVTEFRVFNSHALGYRCWNSTILATCQATKAYEQDESCQKCDISMFGHFDLSKY